MGAFSVLTGAAHPTCLNPSLAQDPLPRGRLNWCCASVVFICSKISCEVLGEGPFLPTGARNTTHKKKQVDYRQFPNYPATYPITLNLVFRTGAVRAFF
jgi:hypothetical protein